jgi:hypothetical protein
MQSMHQLLALALKPVINARHPQIVRCLRCDVAITAAPKHYTQYTAINGCSPLHERCWKTLKTPEARLPYYRQLVFEMWEESGVWPYVEKAVLDGL